MTASDIDAGPEDGRGSDASEPDGSDEGEATAIVFHDSGASLGTPQPGVAVLFHRRDGALIANTTTGANGAASARIERDAMITVVRRDGTSFTTILTRTHVQPGAMLSFGPTAPPPSRLATMTVTWTAAPDPVVGHYDVVTPCGGAFASFDQRSATVAINDACRDTTFPVFVIARQNGDFINQSGLENQTAIDGGTIHLTSWVGATTVVSEIVNVPTGATVLGGISQTFRGRSINVDSRNPGVSIARFELSPVTDSGLEENVRVGGSLQQVLSWRGPFASSRTTDVGAALAPSIVTAGFDVATHAWSWATDVPATPDVQVLRLQYNRSSVGDFIWSVIGPAQLGTSFTLPQLPAELSDLVPLATDRRSGAASQLKLGNGLSFAEVQSTLAQWLQLGIPNDTLPVRWLDAPATLDTVTRSDAAF